MCIVGTLNIETARSIFDFVTPEVFLSIPFPSWKFCALIIVSVLARTTHHLSVYSSPEAFLDRECVQASPKFLRLLQQSVIHQLPCCSADCYFKASGKWLRRNPLIFAAFQFPCFTDLLRKCLYRTFANFSRKATSSIIYRDTSFSIFFSSSFDSCFQITVFAFTLEVNV